MQKSFDIKIIDVSTDDLSQIGFDSSYILQGINKHKFLSLKISNLSCAQANILKQTAISVGTDCAVHRDVITGSITRSDCILSGSISHLKKISDKLKSQPFDLKTLGKNIVALINGPTFEFYVRNKSFNLNNPLIMGILNVTPDSFSDGGNFLNPADAVEHFKTLVADGADIVDIGAEATNTSASPISADEEIKRVLPVIKAIREFDKETVISIDTRNAKTAEIALRNGVDIVNDISALEYDSDMLNVIINNDCPVILMHSNNNAAIEDIMDRLYDYFKMKIDYLIEKGVSKSRIIIDPGIGFPQSVENDWETINRVYELTSLGVPILVGHSRKSFIKSKLCTENNEVLDDATLLLSQKLVQNNVNIVRVHNVKKHALLKLL